MTSAAAYRHGGNLRALAALARRPESAVCDFSANLNPLGPPDWLRSAISRAIDSVAPYPDPDCAALTKAISERYGAAEDAIVVGNGSSEILYALPRALDVSRAVIPVPCYHDYVRSSQLAGLRVTKLPSEPSVHLSADLTDLEGRLRGDEIVFLAHPNNPTGLELDTCRLRSIAREHPPTVFVVDEAFVDFLEHPDSLIAEALPNLVVLRSLTKLYAIAGLRLGFAVASPDLARRIRRFIIPWSVNVFAQAIGPRLLQDTDYANRSRELVAACRKQLHEALSSIEGLRVVPGKANFLLVELTRPGMDAVELANRLLEGEGLTVRVCDDFDGLDRRFFRVAVRCEEDNRRLCTAICRILGGPVRSMPHRRKPAIMFQGCGSSVGKSLLAAAFCRVLSQDGFRVAPFKAQNMSLNSFVTRDGGEMGRAQAVQAQACRLEPDVRMNPILLKPNCETGAQVILLGRPVGNMNMHEYTAFKREAVATVRAAYDSLCREYDAVVLEGAGSPAEINLRQDDIVNMQMARHAGAPVLLVGDIDRGGVFASFVGTLELLSAWERDLVAGFVVNRFWGDRSLLTPAFEHVGAHTGKPVLGMVPYLAGLNMPEEDSVRLKACDFRCTGDLADAIDVAVVDLGHLSNFTDFDALRVEPDVCLRMTRTPNDLGTPDVLIIPGSKNVSADFRRLTNNGMFDAIRDLAAAGKCRIVGICAGLQMLGTVIRDPHHVESSVDQSAGFGLLPLTTVLGRDKRLQWVTGTHIRSGLPIKGYEIHHGCTDWDKAHALVRRDDGDVVGVQTADGRIWGTYVHGIFDTDGFRRWFIDEIRVGRGLQPKGRIVAPYDLEPAFDRLAQVFRESVDVKRIYRLMGL